ncbi:MAG: Fpg/Nei family DNA glycosylase [Candidatus Thorarchaeota archaeon]
MPELPDLEVAKNVLNQIITGQRILDVELQSPVLLRRPTEDGFINNLMNRNITEVSRYGKFLIFHFLPPAQLYINFMLAGRLFIKRSSDTKLKKMGFRLQLENNLDLRYHDIKNMGKIYLLLDDESTILIPGFNDQGPDALDPQLTLDVFRRRIKQFHSVIKHVLLNQRFIAGLGNAYADEILFSAHILPFRKRNTLTDTEIEKLFLSMKSVLTNAIQVISDRVGLTLQFEIRDFLKVHGKPTQPCPVCGNRISTVKSGLRVANFCRTCQV